MNRYDKVKYKNKIWLVLNVNNEDSISTIQDINGNQLNIHEFKLEKVRIKKSN